MVYVRGDTVVHPQHGAAAVTGVIQRDIGSGPTEYLELFVERGSLKIMVPASSMAEVGIRDVSTRREAEKILALLDDDGEVHDRWAERHAVTVARMKSAALSDLALVVRDLTQHAQRTGKPLTSSEKTSRETCIALLARELSLSLQVSEGEATALIVDRSSAAPLAAGVAHS